MVKETAYVNEMRIGKRIACGEASSREGKRVRSSTDTMVMSEFECGGSNWDDRRLCRKRLFMDDSDDNKRACTLWTKAFVAAPYETVGERAVVQYNSTVPPQVRLYTRCLEDKTTPSQNVSIIPYSPPAISLPQQRCTIVQLDSDDENETRMDIES